MAISSSICAMYLYCYFGQVSSESFEQMADILFDTNWPDLSVPMQKYIVIMIANMQKPLHFHGFRMVNLDLKTFINVKI